MLAGSQGASHHRFVCSTGHKTLKASTVQVGDTLAFAGAADSAQVASTVTVTAVKRVKARGAYIPAIAKPFMVAEGVVVPL